MIGRHGGFLLAAALPFLATPCRVDASSALTVAQIRRDGNPVTSREMGITLHSLSGRVVRQGLEVGDSLPNEVSVDVPSTDAVEIAYTEGGRASTATFEPGSTGTLWRAGARELVMVRTGRIAFDDPLRFFNVRAPSLSLSHNLTAFSVDVKPTQITVACSQDSVNVDLLRSSHVQRIDSLSAQGRAAVTYTVTDQGPTASVPLSEVLAAANGGDAVAEYNAGERYEYADDSLDDTPIDYGTAMHWYRLAGAQGNPEAEGSVGTMYYYGLGVRRDYATALSWYERAAVQGDDRGEYEVGSMYYFGDGVPQSYSTALHWYELAAAQGNADAENSLGFMNEHGQALPQDYATALNQYQLAAAQDNAYADDNIGVMYDEGDGVGRDYASAIHWYEQALQNGPYNSIAHYNIAVTAELGHGTPPNYYEAYSEYYHSTLGGSTKYGYIEAWTNLGQMYELGRVPKSSASDARQEAIRYYQVAAGHGSPRAEFRIGYLYERGRWTSRNYAMALHWYRFAAAQGDADAEYRLGVMYDQGLGVAKNYSEALRWYRLAWQSQADLFLPAFHSLMQNFAVNTPSSLEGVAQTQPSAGSIDAAYSLGAMFENGNGVPRDYATALHWYQLAAGLGNPDAKAAAERLSRLRSKPPH